MGKFIIIRGANFSNSSLGEVTPVAPEGSVVLKLSASPSGNGFVNSSGIFKQNSNTEIVALPKADFYMWGDGNSENDRIYNVGAASSVLRAFFKDGSTLLGSFNLSQLKFEQGATTTSGMDDDSYISWGRTQTLYAISSAETLDFTTTFDNPPAIKVSYFDSNFNHLANRYISIGSLPSSVVSVNKNVPDGAAYIRIAVMPYNANPAVPFNLNWLGNNVTLVLS